MEQIAVPETLWSAAVEEADWIAASLAPFDEHLVASVIPPGFQSYARVLHPAYYAMAKGTRKVRWREIADWSGVPLYPDSQFHSIALAPGQRTGPAPWNSQGPERGSLNGGDAEALVELLAAHTSTPFNCLFCMWDGWGWDTAMSAALPGEVPLPIPDPVPAEVRQGPRVRLPHRDYLLYTGSIEAALAFAGTPGQTPNLWWPADRAWCVASEVDLRWSYVGGSAALIEELLADPAVEALPAVPSHRHSWVEEFIVDDSESSVPGLISTGKATIETACGTIRATLRRPGRLGRGGSLQIQSDALNGVSSRTAHRLGASSDAELATQICGYLITALIGLVED
jgi:hypothetical protein